MKSMQIAIINEKVHQKTNFILSFFLFSFIICTFAASIIHTIDGNDTLYQKGRDMECCVAWRGYSVGCRVRHHLLGLVFPGRQQLGEGRGYPLSLRYAGFVCGFNALSLDEAPLEMEGTASKVGSCSYLLAYRGFVFTADTDGSA